MEIARTSFARLCCYKRVRYEIVHDVILSYCNKTCPVLHYVSRSTF
jgi:hypothetical protein